MKFVCDRCGKKYATAEDPAPGKVYKLKCKACGHLIVVKGQAGTMTGIPAITAAEMAMASSAQDPLPTPLPTPLSEPPPEPPSELPPETHPEIELHVEPEGPGLQSLPAEPEPEPVSDDAIEPLPGPSNLPPEVASAVDGAASAAHPDAPSDSTAPPEPAPALDPALVPPSPEKDELADFAAAAAEVMAAPFATGAGEPPHKGGPGYVDLFGDITDQRALAARSTITDAFQVATRRSLPDTWTGPAPSSGQAGGTPAALPVKPAAAIPLKAAPRSGLGGTPIAIIGVGMLALVGITAWALLGRGSPPPPATVSRPAPPPAALPPRPAPEVKPPEPEPVMAAKAEPEPKPEQKPEPKVVEKRPEPKPEPKAEPKPRPPERKPEPKPQPPKVAEKRAEPPPEAAPEQRTTEPRDAEVPDAATALTQDVVNRVVGANRKAFTGCITSAADSGVKLDGRRVALRITVNTNGTVTYPTLDDQSLNATEMGQCLKSAARLMIFPKFKGDPFHYEVPLILSGS
jgi:outer membrane biosynthesis protein TonB/DNA-directed RNA polymerase subunit RPC12/RpoP